VAAGQGLFNDCRIESQKAASARASAGTSTSSAPNSSNQGIVRSKNANIEVVSTRSRPASDRVPMKIVLSGTSMSASTRATTASISDSCVGKWFVTVVGDTSARRATSFIVVA
jgi:hypothetical protein